MRSRSKQPPNMLNTVLMDAQTYYKIGFFFFYSILLRFFQFVLEQHHG